MNKRAFSDEEKFKKMIYAFSITLVISIVAFATIFVMYNKKLKEESSASLLELGKINTIVDNNQISETSITSDKGKNEIENIAENTTATIPNTTKNTATVKNTTNTTPVAAEVKEENTTNEEKIEEAVELKFMAPVSGDIIKDFATDTLIYSNTLGEWTTHPGIDIASSRTSIVVAAEAGVVESIKNDPRYGLTVTISHANGFKTVYSNLLTSEFVSQGKTVEKGQTIATVGETSSFEIADESHLHFEMYKDGELVNPTIYLK